MNEEITKEHAYLVYIGLEGWEPLRFITRSHEDIKSHVRALQETIREEGLWLDGPERDGRESYIPVDSQVATVEIEKLPYWE